MRLLRSVAAIVQSVRSAWRGTSSVEDRNILLLTLDTTLAGVPNAGFGTFISVFMARLGASSLAISALTSLPALMSVLVSLPGSAWVERQRDHARLTALLRAAYSVAWWALVLLPSLVSAAALPAFIVALSTVQAIPIAMATVAFTSVVGDIVPARRRPTVNGLRWALTSVVTGLAVVGFGRLLDAGWLTFPHNYQLVFLISALGLILNVVLFARIKVSRTVPAVLAASSGFRQQISQLLRPMMRSPAFLRFLAVAVVIQLGMNVPVALYSIYWVRVLNASDTIIGLRTMVAQGAVIAGSLLFGRIVSKHGHLGTMLASAIGMSLYPILTALSPNAWWLLPAAAVFGLFSGAINVAFFEGILVTTPDGKVPSFTALYFVVISAANFVGPLIGSALAGWLGIPVTFWICGAVLVSAAILCWWVNRHKEPPVLAVFP